MELRQPFVKLPWRFDAERLAEEVRALPESAWMAHPSRMQGNSAVALVSRGGGDNDDFDGEMALTAHLEACPYMMQVMASFGEVLGRSRLMRLAPGAEVALHVDFNYHWVSRLRLHIPVVTDPRVLFQCADEKVHMAAGECWTFNSWRRHRVINGGEADRIHLVVDTSGSSRLWRVVEAAQREAGEPSPGEAELLPYRPRVRADIEVERYNSAPVMAPGELDGLVAALLAEIEAFPGNDAERVKEYRQLLQGFCKDWRVTWVRHGFRRSGWPEYRELIEAVRAQLHPEPRALVTGSNQIGVNPIIQQRILAPALAEVHFERMIGDAARES